MFTIKHYLSTSGAYSVYEATSYSVTYSGSTDSDVSAAHVRMCLPCSEDEVAIPTKEIVLRDAFDKAYVSNSQGQTVDCIRPRTEVSSARAKVAEVLMSR